MRRAAFDKKTGYLLIDLSEELSEEEVLKHLAANDIKQDIEVRLITEEEVSAAVIIRNKAMLPYPAKRREEYPPFTDYLDGIVKGDQAQVQAYIDACLAVKNKYPKV
jgi:hypothetical protein